MKGPCPQRVKIHTQSSWEESPRPALLLNLRRPVVAWSHLFHSAVLLLSFSSPAILLFTYLEFTYLGGCKVSVTCPREPVSKDTRLRFELQLAGGGQVELPWTGVESDAWSWRWESSEIPGVRNRGSTGRALVVEEGARQGLETKGSSHMTAEVCPEVCCRAGQGDPRGGHSAHPAAVQLGHFLGGSTPGNWCW